MEIKINHYIILGFKTTEEGLKATQIEISKAYRIKALELHPDKRPNDPNAVVEFQQLNSSYEILKDDKTRKEFDDRLRAKSEQEQRQSQDHLQRKQMRSDLEERERASVDLKVKREEEEEERILKSLMEEVEGIRAKYGRRSGGGGGGIETPTPTPTPKTTPLRSEEGKSEGLRCFVKVSWEGNEDDYSSQKLRDLFEEFGDVEDVVILPTGSKRKRRKSALVVIANKDVAVSVMGSVCGDLSNPLFVNKVEQTVSSSLFPPWYVASGASFQANEASILDKVCKAAKKQKRLAEEL